MEDEECLPENSSLNVYLRNLGYSDIQNTKKVVRNPNVIRFEVSKSKTKWPQVETIDEDVIDQIGIIISTQLLFEENVLSIEKLLSNFEVVRSGMLKSMFKGFLGVLIIFVGLCLYWLIGYYAFMFVSSFYAYNVAHYMRRKYFYRFRLKKLSAIIQGNFMLLKKTVKFIEENSLIESQCISNSNSKEFLEGFDFFKNFKNDFVSSVNKMNNIFMNSTQKLIYKVPLYDYIENPEYYLCNNFKKDFESVNLSKLYEIYLLLQSEFLQRLILSLIPNIKLSAKDDFNEINEIITETCVSLLKIKKIINKKFKFLFFNGIHSSKAGIEFKLSKRNELSSNVYLQEFLFNIHDVSKIFQNLLLKCRILEENLTSEKKPEFLEEELMKMQSHLNSCQRNITDCLILLKRSNAMTGKCDEVSVQEVEEVENSNEAVGKVEVGFSDLDPKIEDEIFEVFLANEKAERNTLDEDDWDLKDRLQKKLEKEYCKNMMKELKVRLVEKAKSWKKREREVLKKKGVIDTNDDFSGDESHSGEDENGSEASSENGKALLKKQNRFHDFETNSEKPDIPQEINEENLNLKNLTSTQKVPFESQEELQVAEKNYDSTITPESLDTDTSALDEIPVSETESTHLENSLSPMGSFKTDFFNDLNKARERIFKSSVAEEELFCDSGEDESD